MKIKLDKYAVIVGLILVIAFCLRFNNLDSYGYSTDEPVIIVAGIKHFIGNSYDPSLYDMATPGGQWPIGLFITLLSDREFSALRDWSMMDYASIDLNYELLEGLEFYARLPSAIAGFLSCILVYLLVKEMFGKKAGVISLALFSFNPILIDYSRIALLEIYQIFYMLAAMYFFYLFFTKKNKKLLVASSVFLGLAFSAKLNVLILLPLFVLFIVGSKLNIKNKKNIVTFDFIGAIINSLILISVSLFTLMFTFGFDINTPITIFNYYSGAGGTGIQFILLNLLYDSLFFVNPLVWLLVIYSIYALFKQDKKNINDWFCLFLIFVIFVSGFFEAHSSIKRGIQYILLFFIISAKIFSTKHSKWLNYIPLIIVISNLILIGYYFPNTGLAKSIICTSQECQDAHVTRNYDSRIVGEYFDNIENSIVYDPIATTGLTGFYTQPYVSGGIAKLQIGDCPNIEIIRTSGFTHVIENNGCLHTIIDDLENCEYESIFVKNYEITKVYDLSTCS